MYALSDEMCDQHRAFASSFSQVLLILLLEHFDFDSPLEQRRADEKPV
jgi:hypothetical protein